MTFIGSAAGVWTAGFENTEEQYLPSEIPDLCLKVPT